MNYKVLVLSKNEKVEFVLKGIILSFSISLLFYNNIWFSIPIVIIYISSLKDYKEKLKKKREDELLLEFKDMLYSISSSIQTGRSMKDAIKESIAFWENTYKAEDYIIRELNYMAKQMEDGHLDDDIVLIDFGDRTGISDIKDFSMFYKRSKESGANLIKGIKDATELISEKIQLENDLKITINSKKFEGKIVTIAPFVVLLFLRLTSGSYLNNFLNTNLGHILASVSLLLIFLSYVLTERITKIEI